jgi:hypothetical protein
MRDQFCVQVRACQKEMANTRYRKPSETYNNDGTPKEQHASAHILKSQHIGTLQSKYTWALT